MNHVDSIIRSFGLTAVLLSCTLTACSSSDEEAESSQDELTAIPFPSTVELSANDLTALERADADGTLVFSAAPEALANVKVGSVIVGGVSGNTPHGLLRAVLAVERAGSTMTLETAQAPIQLAYRKLHVRFARSHSIAESATANLNQLQTLGRTSDEPGRRVQALGSGDDEPGRRVQALGGSYDETRPFNYMLFDADSDPSTENDQIAVAGAIGGGFDYDFRLNVDWGLVDALPDVVTSCLESLAKVLVGEKPDCSLDALLPEAKVSFVVEPIVHADATVHGAAILEYEKEVDLASSTLPPIVIGPLVFVPAVDLTAALSGGASAAFSTGVTGSAQFETAVTVSSKQTSSAQFSAPRLKRTDLSPKETRVSLHAEAKVGAGARLNLLLFGVTGPYVNAQAYGAVKADVLNQPCWSLHAGVDAELGIRVTSPALPVLGQLTLVDWQAPSLNPLDFEVASGNCDAPPDSPTLPPGSGPDAQRYAQPTFSPWSRTFADAVDASIAASPGNDPGFADLQRTIDDHVVRAGWGTKSLVKLSQRGDVAWAKDLAFEGASLRPLRVRPTRDAGLAVLASAVTAPIVITTLNQDGSVATARGYDIPFEVCTVDPTAFAPDGSSGFYVAGGCAGQAYSFVLHAGENSSALWLLTPDETPKSRITVLTTIEDDLFVSGRLLSTLDRMFALRMSRTGQVRYAKRYEGCPEAPDAIPSAALVGPRGEVTLAGSGGAIHNGTIVRLLADGSVGFATSPGYGFGLGSVFVLDSLVELPTTGFVAGGSGVRFTTEGPASVPSAALVGFDSGGRILWANRYTFGAPGAFQPAGQVAVQLTDDGGIYASSMVVNAADPLGGSLWAFKAYARNGAIDFSPASVTVTPLEIENLDCPLTAHDVPLTISDVSIVERTLLVTTSDVRLTVTQQTAE